MDIETSEAIETLRGDIQGVETTLTAEIHRVETTLRAEIGKLRTEMVTRDEFTAKMESMRDELKRHTDIRYESLHDDIRIIAEGYASLAEGIAAMNARMDRQFGGSR